jgi:hypothetical protein
MFDISQKVEDALADEGPVLAVVVQQIMVGDELVVGEGTGHLLQQLPGLLRSNQFILHAL